MEMFFIEKQVWDRYIAGKSKNRKIYGIFETNEKFLSNKSQFVRPVDGHDGQNLFWETVTPDNARRIVYDRMHPVPPLKIFFFPFKERIVPAVDNTEPFMVIGATNCDLLALDSTDRVFINDLYRDPAYSIRRQQGTLVSIDCLKPNEFCFCELLGNRPYPEKNFDLNLTLIENGFIAETGSDKGRVIIEELGKPEPASAGLISRRAEMREYVSGLVNAANSEYGFPAPGHLRKEVPEFIKDRLETPLWADGAYECIQCGSCNASCPTCVCFLLDDRSTGKNFSKSKIWDYCLLQSYAKMTSGVSPRPLLKERYANRLLCKYQYMVQNYGIVGCTGCGRCISGCPGKINKRKVINDIYLEKSKDVVRTNEKI